MNNIKLLTSLIIIASDDRLSQNIPIALKHRKTTFIAQYLIVSTVYLEDESRVATSKNILEEAILPIDSLSNQVVFRKEILAT